MTTETTTVDATTTTSLVTSTVVNVEPTGIAYYYFYPENYTPGDEYASVPTVVADVSGNENYEYSGTISNLNTIFIAYNGVSAQPFTLPNSDNTVPGTGFAMIFQGYLFAADGGGTYTISSAIDDVTLIWLGPNKAYGTQWNYDNRDLLNECCTAASTTSVTLAAGEAYPLTIFYANTGGQGSTNYNIITPDGTTHHDTTPFLLGGCEGAAVLFEP